MWSAFACGVPTLLGATQRISTVHVLKEMEPLQLVIGVSSEDSLQYGPGDFLPMGIYMYM